MTVKFCTAEGTVPNFTLICEYFGVSGPKNTRKIDNIANFFSRQGRTPYPMLVKSVGFMRLIGLQKLFNIWSIRLVN